MQNGKNFDSAVVLHCTVCAFTSNSFKIFGELLQTEEGWYTLPQQEMTSEHDRGERRPRPSEIHEALRRVLNSTPFHGSKQCQDLLRYLVEQALTGGE